MKYFKKKGTKLILLSVFLAIVFLLTLNKAGRPQHKKITKFTAADYQIEKERLLSDLQKMSAKQAFERLKEKFGDQSPEIQNLVHGLAHLFGQELFKKEGFRGIQICDNSFQNGCFHGFMAESVKTFGKQAIPLSEKYCKDLPKVSSWNCFHGLGHGLMEGNGFKLPGLLTALGNCDLLGVRNFQENCYLGVFMEYNRRPTSLAYSNGLGLRPMDNNNPYDPCNLIAKKYQSMCFEEAPWWWYYHLHSLGEDKMVDTMIGLCNNAGGGFENQNECFFGVGMITAVDTNDISSLQRNCKKIPESNNLVSCARGAKYILQLRNNSDAGKVCDLFDKSPFSSYRTLCLMGLDTRQVGVF